MFAVLLKSKVMKNLLYVISGLLVVIWSIVYFGFHTSGTVHIILAVAAFIAIIRYFFYRELTSR
jgi:tryptophan-rich sensory protein